MKMFEDSHKRKILVIGSNSFSGSDFIDLLLEDCRNEVVGVSRAREKSSLFLPYRNRDKHHFKFYRMDLNKDMLSLFKLMSEFRPQYVVNFAAQSEVGPSWCNPEHWFQTNVVALARLTNELRDKSWLRKYLHISSPEVYGTCEGTVTESATLNPSTPYAASKAAADLFLSTLARNFDFPLVTVRSTNVYGKHQQLWKIIPRSVIYLKLRKVIELHGGGRAVKSYIHIRDVSRGELLAMSNGKAGEIYHLSPSPDNDGYAVKDIVSRICHRMKKSFKEMTQVVEERVGQDAAYVIDSTKARRELGWAPSIKIDDGISEVVDWIEGNWSEVQNEPLHYAHRV